MVVLDIKVEGKEKKLYMDGHLQHQIVTKIRPKVKKKDFDWVWIVDGPEGSGKSVLAMQIAKVLDENFDINNVCFTANNFTKAILKAKKGDCIVWDEAFTGLSSRASLTETNKLIVSLMMEMRQKNLFVIIVMPTIFLLDRYVALFRARGLFHVYTKEGKRGRWVYFNKRKKKLLYILGKKLYSYTEPRSSFRGRFQDQYTINEKLYREKKGQALMEKSRSTKAEVYKLQRDALIYYLYKKEKYTQNKISSIFPMYEPIKSKLERRSISDIINKIELEIKKDEMIEEIRKEEAEKEKKENKSNQ